MIQAHLASPHRLQRLRRYLMFEGLGWLLLLGSFILATDVVLRVLVILALLFTPYLLWTLYQEKRFGWIVIFAAMVGVPGLLALISSDSVILRVVLQYLPLLMFYIYCMMLRWAIDEWLADLVE